MPEPGAVAPRPVVVGEDLQPRDGRGLLSAYPATLIHGSALARWLYS